MSLFEEVYSLKMSIAAIEDELKKDNSISEKSIKRIIRLYELKKSYKDNLQQLTQTL